MSWKEIELGDAFSIIRNGASIKQTDNESGIPITRIETIADGEIDYSKLGYANISTEKFCDYYLKEGDILMSHINSWKHLGKTAIVKNDIKKIIHGMNLLLLRSNIQLLYPPFIKYYFECIVFKQQLDKISNQSVNQSSFTSSKLKKLLIPLPPLLIQKKIADILDKADALRKKDQQLLQKYDELAQAIFIEMFGDPVKNEKGWEVKTLNDYLSVDSKTVDPLKLDCYNYVGLEHIEKETGKLLIRENESVVSNKFRFTSDHILYGKLRPYLNKVAIPTFDGICSTDIFPLKPHKHIMKSFLVAVLRSPHFVNYSNTGAVGANLPRANKSLILQYSTICPDDDSLILFSSWIQIVKEQVQQIEETIQSSESLFQSLLQQAFKGELIA